MKKRNFYYKDKKVLKKENNDLIYVEKVRYIHNLIKICKKQSKLKNELLS